MQGFIFFNETYAMLAAGRNCEYSQYLKSCSGVRNETCVMRLLCWSIYHGISMFYLSINEPASLKEYLLFQVNGALKICI